MKQYVNAQDVSIAGCNNKKEEKVRTDVSRFFLLLIPKAKTNC